MNQSSGTKVFILGAGCSADCGYPLGKELAGQLKEFQTEILGHFPIIEQCVRGTIDLAKQFPQFDTLDQLTKHAEDDFNSWRQRERSFVWDNTDQQRENLLYKQIVDAKIATVAMFLANEEKARKTRLQNYERFIASIFGGEPWQEAVKAASCHVLTFNYDRLFEIAFFNHFKHFDPQSVFLYGNGALNSGFNPRFDQVGKVEPKPGQFSFLKLHGSAGWWVKKNLHQHEDRHYWPPAPTNLVNLQDIENLLKKNGVYSSETLNSPNGMTFPWEPLVAFPHERQFEQDFFEQRRQSSGYSWAQYVDTIWNHAAVLLEAATEVKVIGYSFNPIDSRYVIEKLMTKIKCDKIVIQNPAKQDVEAALKSYRQLQGRWEFDLSRFGENL